MTTQAQASGFVHISVDDGMWVDNPPPGVPAASGSGASSRPSAPSRTPVQYEVGPVSATPSYPPHSIDLDQSSDRKGKRKASPTPLCGPRPMYPMGPPIPLLLSGQARKNPLPDKLPSDRSPSPPSWTSYSALSSSPDASADEDGGRNNRSTQTGPPAIRVRRVGALNISVSSDSESSFSSRAAGREWNRSRQETGSNDEESSGPSRELSGDSSERDSRGRHRVDEDQYRTIVDGLAVQNRTLKGRLRKYESVKMSPQMENDRLFELRFFDGIPQEKRRELEGFLTRYVQGLAPLPTHFSPAPSSAAATHATSPPPVVALSPSHSAPMAPPVIPDRPLLPASRAHRHVAERERLAGPSNSGLEPASFTGTGNGMRVRYAQEHGHIEVGRRGSQGRGVAQDDTPSAREIVGIVERLFEDAIGQVVNGRLEGPPLLRRESSGSGLSAVDRADEGEGEGEPNGTTNEAYLAHLLKYDLNQWQYLNLTIQMSRLIRFAVTPAFVRSAIRTFSTKLEVSAEGSRVRWIGDTSGAAHTQPEMLRTSSAESVQTEARMMQSNGPASTAGSRSTSTGTSSAQPSSSDQSLLANSKLGTTEGGSTVATSVSTSSQKPQLGTQPGHHSPGGGPTRPAPVALQPAPHDTDHPLVQSPEPLGLGPLSAKQPTSRYVPYFGRANSTRRAKASSASASSSTETRSTSPAPSGLTRRQPSAAKLAASAPAVGMMTFFANAHFCSDLSTNRVGLAPVAPAMEDEDGMAILGCATRVAEKAVPAAALCPGPEAPSSELLAVSGMTEVVPADLFTVRVRTAYRADSPVPDAVEPLGAVGIALHASERRRTRGWVVRIEETREDACLRIRRPLSAGELCDSPDGLPVHTDSSLSAKRIRTASEGGSGSASSNGRKEAGAKRHERGRADYLVSLAAPLYDWAPEGVSRSNLRKSQVGTAVGVEDKVRAPRRGEIVNAGRKGPSASGLAESASGVSGFSGSVARSGEEAPISLSELVRAHV